MVIILISYAVFLTVRPHIQEAKYDKYTQMVEEHLERNTLMHLGKLVLIKKNC